MVDMKDTYIHIENIGLVDFKINLGLVGDPGYKGTKHISK